MGDELGVKEGTSRAERARIWWRPLQLQVKAVALSHNQFPKQNPSFGSALRRCLSNNNTCIHVTHTSREGTYSNKSMGRFLIISNSLRSKKWPGSSFCCCQPSFRLSPGCDKQAHSDYFPMLPLLSYLCETFPSKLQQQAAPFLFYSRTKKNPKKQKNLPILASSRGEKAPCSGNAALNIFTLKIDRIFTRRNAARSYLFRSRQCEIHRGSACKNKEKTVLKSVQV